MYKGLDRCVIPSCQAKQEGSHAPATDTVRYFAYGANMASSTLAKRDIKPLSACPAQLPAHSSIAFRHRGGYATIIESSVTSSTPPQWQIILDKTPVPKGRDQARAPKDHGLVYHGAHGVLYELKKADMQKLAGRETGYALGSTTVTSYAGTETSALLFTSQPLLLLPASVPPQRRYLELMLEGAKTHGLAPEYMQWLHELPCARPGGLGAEYFDTPSELLARCAAVGLAACAAFYAAVH